MCLRNTHLVGYGAQYYAYLYAKSLAAMAWKQCLQDDPFNKAAGKLTGLEKNKKNLAAHPAWHPGILYVVTSAEWQCYPGSTFQDTLL